MPKILPLITLFLCAAQLGATEVVVLLHGLARSDSSMKKMEEALSEEGYHVINVDYPSRTESIHELSDLAIGKALADPGIEDSSVIHFVTHSLGGILVRSYFSRHDNGKLGRVVMLGPPNKGSEVVDRIGSWWIFETINGPAGKELGTGADSVPNKLGPVDFELGIISGDRSINWINSLMIEGSDDGKVSVDRTKVSGMKEHIVLHVTHPFLMKNDEAIKYTINFLKTGSFNIEETDLPEE